MLTTELAVLLPRLVDGRGPSYDELTRMTERRLASKWAPFMCE